MEEHVCVSVVNVRSFKSTWRARGLLHVGLESALVKIFKGFELVYSFAQLSLPKDVEREIRGIAGSDVCIFYLLFWDKLERKTLTRLSLRFLFFLRNA